MVEVDRLGLDPYGMMQIERNPRDLPAQRRHHDQTRPDVRLGALEVVRATGLLGEEADLDGMLGFARTVVVDEQGVAAFTSTL
jgi:hypothetical protein